PPGFDAMDLKHLLCKVEPDGGNCSHGRPSMVICHQRSLYGTSMPYEAPSTSSRAVVASTRRRSLLYPLRRRSLPPRARSGCPLRHLHPLLSSVRTPNRQDDPKAVEECDEVAK